MAAALNGSGTTTAAQLYAPYGTVRYSSGAMPTDYGYTGQRADSATGLDYYGARYYDPAGGQFASADTVSDGLNRYGYVGGNPTTATDPTGHAQVLDGGGGDTTYLDCGEGNYSGCPTAPPANPTQPACTHNCGGGTSDRGASGGGCAGHTCMPAPGTKAGTASPGDCVSEICALHPPKPFKDCWSEKWCARGYDSAGLLSGIAYEFRGQPVNTLVGVGYKGLLWLIDRLREAQQALDSVFAYQWGVGGLGSAAIFAGTFTPCSIACFITGLVTSGEAVAIYLTQLNVDKKFTRAIQELESVQSAYENGQASWVDSAHFDVGAVPQYDGAGLAAEDLIVETYIYDW